MENLTILQLYAINTKVSVVTIFCGLNFCGDKLLWVRVVHHSYHVANFSSVQFFVGISSPQKVVPNEIYCVHDSVSV